MELVLRWSGLCLSFVVLGPVLLSLAVGVWFQSKNPTDLATVQTAWGMASYVTIAGRSEDPLSNSFHIVINANSYCGIVGFHHHLDCISDSENTWDGESHSSNSGDGIEEDIGHDVRDVFKR